MQVENRTGFWIKGFGSYVLALKCKAFAVSMIAS